MGHKNAQGSSKTEVNLCMWSQTAQSSMQSFLYLLYSGHSNAVSSCVFSHNNHYLVTASWDKTLHIYDIATGIYRHLYIIIDV